MKPATAEAPARPALVPLRRGLDLTALAALFVLTLREQLRGRRLLLLSLLFLLPGVLAVVLRLAPFAPPPEKLEFALIFNLIPHVLATLTALLYAAGIIRDEVEGQTLTYLLLRPLPRWALYLTKLAATVLVTSALTGVFTVLTFAVIYWGTAEFWGGALPVRALQAALVMALAQAAYCSLFAVLGMVTRWALLGGLAYIIVFEGVLANFDFVGRRLTVMYYFRVLSLRWLDLPAAEGWSLDLATAASASACVLILLGASAVFALLGAALMMGREFRMKTPEGS
jgi:ABC-2 type transport system permease protein